MTYSFRVKTYDDEEGEYSEYQPCSKESILQLIQGCWATDPRINGLEVISITNDNGQHLLLAHDNKQVFDVYFLPKATKFHLHKRVRSKSSTRRLIYFFGPNIDELETYLNKTTKENRYIRGDFFFKDHNYRLTKERSIREGIWMLWAVSPALLASIALFRTQGTSSKVIILLFTIALLLLVLPGLFLHLQYKRDIGNWTIRVTKGQDRITVRSPTTEKALNKADLVKIVKHVNSAYRIPWSEYGYTELEFKTGEIINLTSLIVDQTIIEDKFANNVSKYKVDEVPPSIKRPTNLE